MTNKANGNAADDTAAFAAIGRKQAELDTLNAEYDRLLATLAQVVSGEVARERITVDLAARCWNRAALPDQDHEVKS